MLVINTNRLAFFSFFFTILTNLFSRTLDRRTRRRDRYDGEPRKRRSRRYDEDGTVYRRGLDETDGLKPDIGSGDGENPRLQRVPRDHSAVGVLLVRHVDGDRRQRRLLLERGADHVHNGFGHVAEFRAHVLQGVGYRAPLGRRVALFVVGPFRFCRGVRSGGRRRGETAPFAANVARPYGAGRVRVRDRQLSAAVRLRGVPAGVRRRDRNRGRGLLPAERVEHAFVDVVRRRRVQRALRMVLLRRVGQHGGLFAVQLRFRRGPGRRVRNRSVSAANDRRRFGIGRTENRKSRSSVGCRYTSLTKRFRPFARSNCNFFDR